VTYNFSPHKKLSQGDILRHIRAIANVVGGEGNGPKYKESNIIVVSRNCEIDKGTNSVLVARLARLKSQREEFRGVVRAGEVLNAFYLPSEGPLMDEESYIDWRTLQQISKEELMKMRYQLGCYRCSLGEIMLKACLGSLIEFFTKPEEEE